MDPPSLWHNNGNETFTDHRPLSGLSPGGDRHGAAWGDYDNDGDNGNGNHWLKILLKGTLSNRDGIGAKVMLQTNGLIQLREVNGGGGGQYFSQGGGPVHFGLGQVNKIDALLIQWPSVRTQIISNLSANQELTVVEEPVSP